MPARNHCCWLQTIYCTIFCLLFLNSICFVNSSIPKSKSNSAVPENIDSAKFVMDDTLNITRIDLNKNASIELHNRWREQAICGLMAAMANKHLLHLPKTIATRHEKCVKQASSVHEHAECVSDVLSLRIQYARKTRRKNAISLRKSKRRFEKYKPKPLTRVLKFADETEETKEKMSNNDREKSRPIRRRQRRSETTSEPFKRVNKDSYILSSPSKTKITPVGLFARFMTESILQRKNKTSTISLQDRLSMIRKLEARNKATQPVASMDLETILGNPISRKAYIDEQKASSAQTPMGKLSDFFRQGIRLGMGLMGHNTTDFDKKVLKFGSPQFMSLGVEEQDPSRKQEDIINILSPSVLSFKDVPASGNEILPLGSLLSGFGPEDKKEILNFVMEASDVDEHLELAEKALELGVFHKNAIERYKREMVNDAGEPLYFTKEKAAEVGGKDELRRIELFENLTKSYTALQLRQLNEGGHSTLTPEQVKLVYGPESPHADAERMEAFLKLLASNTTAEDALEAEVHALAAQSRHSRRKRDTNVLTPTLLTSLVLDPVGSSVSNVMSPVLFSALILSPSLIGINLLSPWVFRPMVLSPRLITPAILNPTLFVPSILSPLMMQPTVLSPGIFNPYILSPLVMTPFILTPQVFSPAIVAPMLLSPLVLSAHAFSPQVLSPAALSPTFMTPHLYSPLYLSPRWLAPAIMSPLIATDVVLSPGFIN